MKALRRTKSGMCTVDLVAALFVFILLLLLPLIDLATIALRVTFVHMAARNAARSAGRASTYEADSKEGEPSAKRIATSMALASRDAGLAGVEINPGNVMVSIIGSPLKTTVNPIRQTTVLKSVELHDYLYQVEVKVSGQVQPLVIMSKDMFGSIPGLTTPIPITACYREMCEHPGGLSK